MTQIDTSPAAVAQATGDEAIATLDAILQALAEKNGVARPEDVAPQAVAGLETLRTLDMEINGHNPARIAETVTLLITCVTLDRDRLAVLSEEWRMECLAQNEALSAALERAEQAEAQLAEARAEGWRRGIEAAAEVCTAVIRDYRIMKKDGVTYETVRVQHVAQGLVSVAREDIRALPMPDDLGARA
jgi:hypothetical protein